jgi:D-arginine dehydrogenase
MSDADVIIIGGGIAGASTACFLSPHARVMILEAEAHVGYHTTGRSAAFFSESYGGPAVQPLTVASKAFLFHPPEGFTDVPLVRLRRALHVARQDQQQAAQTMLREYGPLAPNLHMVGKAEVDSLAPMLKSDWAMSGVYDPDCQDIDVDALHQGYLRQARQKGAQLFTNAPVIALSRDHIGWRVSSRAGSFTAPIIVNAAGAWGDAIAALACLPSIGLQPLLRTIITFSPTGFPVQATAPLVLDVDGQFYFKPDGLNIWASPADETPTVASDVQPDELTVAITVDRLEKATRYAIPAISRRWAGLRTFTPDRAPVFGFDPRAPGFFWCVGQGGFGIQTSAAAGMLCAAQLAGMAVPENLQAYDVNAKRYGLGRLLGS